MPSDESGSALEVLQAELISIQESIRNLEERKLALEERIMTAIFGSPDSITEGPAAISDEELMEAPALVEPLAPRLVTPPEGKQYAVLLASSLTEPLVKCFVAVKDEVLRESGKVHAALWQEVERLRHTLDSSIGSLSTQLGQQQEELSSAIRSVNAVQVRQCDALRQLAETLIRFAATTEPPPPQANTQL